MISTFLLLNTVYILKNKKKKKKSMKISRLLLSPRVKSIRSFGNYKVLVEPWEVSPRLAVPSSIARPDYSKSAHPKKITINQDNEIKGIKSSCNLAAQTLLHVLAHVKVLYLFLILPLIFLFLFYFFSFLFLFIIFLSFFFSHIFHTFSTE